MNFGTKFMVSRGVITRRNQILNRKNIL